MAKKYPFPKKNRITSKKDFNAIFRDRKKIYLPHLIVFYRANDIAQCRLGISIGRKFGNAVHRNLFKRRVREVFRLKHCFCPVDMVVIPNYRNKSVHWHDLFGEMETAIGKIYHKYGE